MLKGEVVVVVLDGTVGGRVEEVDTVPVCVEHATHVRSKRKRSLRIERHYAVAMRLASVL
jgi:hypothetical protein